MDCKTKNICIDEAVTVRLWNTENMSENILQSRLDKKQKICTFTHLSSRDMGRGATQSQQRTPCKSRRLQLKKTNCRSSSIHFNLSV